MRSPRGCLDGAAAAACCVAFNAARFPIAATPRMAQSSSSLLQSVDAPAHPRPCRDIKPENVMFAEPPAAVAAAAPPVITAADLQAGRSAGHKAAPGKGAGAAAMPTVKLLDLGMACLYDPTKPQRGERMVAGAVGID